MLKTNVLKLLKPARVLTEYLHISCQFKVHFESNFAVHSHALHSHRLGFNTTDARERLSGQKSHTTRFSITACPGRGPPTLESGSEGLLKQKTPLGSLWSPATPSHRPATGMGDGIMYRVKSSLRAMHKWKEIQATVLSEVPGRYSSSGGVFECLAFSVCGRNG